MSCRCSEGQPCDPDPEPQAAFEYMVLEVPLPHKPVADDEYLRECIYAAESELDKAGESGWELVSVDQGWAYLKRPLEGAEKE